MSYMITQTKSWVDYESEVRMEDNTFVGIFDKEETDKFISALLKKNFTFDVHYIGTNIAVFSRHEDDKDCANEDYDKSVSFIIKIYNSISVEDAINDFL